MKRSEMLTHVCAAFEAHGVDWCVLHGYDELPERIASDVDLLVAAKDFGRVPAILAGIPNSLLVQALDYRVNSRYFVLASREAPGAFLAIDVACELRAEWCKLMEGADLLKDKRRLREQFWVPAPAPAFVAYLLKKILKQRYLGAAALDAHSGEKLTRLFAADREGCMRQLNDHLAPEDVRLIVEAAHSGQWQHVATRLPSLRRSLNRRARRRMTGGELLREVGGELQRRWRRLAQPTGLMVALYGVDGAGKSTVIRELAARLTPLFRRVSVQHWRPNLIGLRRGASTGRAPHEAAPRSRALSWLQLTYWWLHFSVGACVVYFMKTYSTLVLFDRYFHDARVDPLRYRSVASAALLRWVGRSIMAPDLTFVLDVPAAIAHARKPEHSPQRLPMLTSGYRTLGAELPHAHVIDANRALPAVVEEIAGVILHHLRERTATRLGLCA